MQHTIKSFVLRTGRVSHRQQQALNQWLKHYQLPPPGSLWSLENEFKRSADVIVEIGFGMGSSLLSMAIAQPNINFIGIEVHLAGIGSLAASIHEQAINNVRLAPYNAIDVFKTSLNNNELQGIQIFFPDPWPKKRHQKRRFIQTDVVHLLAQKIKPGGFLHCATDWKDYAEQMLKVLSAEPLLKNNDQEGGFIPRPPSRPLTKFEQRGHLLGHNSWDLLFEKIDFFNDPDTI